MEPLLEQVGNVMFLRISGSIGLNDMDEFDSVLTSLVTPEIERLCVDCSNLDNWDDAVIASMVNLAREYEGAKRKVAIFGLSPKLRAELDRRGMTVFLPVVETQDDALELLGADDSASGG